MSMYLLKVCVICISSFLLVKFQIQFGSSWKPPRDPPWRRWRWWQRVAAEGRWRWPPKGRRTLSAQELTPQCAIGRPLLFDHGSKALQKSWRFHDVSSPWISWDKDVTCYQLVMGTFVEQFLPCSKLRTSSKSKDFKDFASQGSRLNFLGDAIAWPDSDCLKRKIFGNRPTRDG